MRLTIVLLFLLLQLFNFIDCDERAPDEVGNRIFGGVDAPITKVPWQLQILRIPKKQKDKIIPICGAAIIGAEYVLTASHCFRKGNNDPAKYLIRSGTELANGQKGVLHRVVKISVREDYDVVLRQHSVNDIALVKVDPPFIFGPNVQKVELPDSDPASGTLAISSGWGYKDLRKSVRAKVLQMTNLKVMNREECNTNTNWRGMVPKKSFCAGGDGKKSSCKGDSGGPLVVNNTLVGVVSWGYSQMCAKKGYPTVFTSVAAFKPWIVKLTKE